MGPGGNITTNSKTNFNFNKYKREGIGASTIANRHAKNRLASFCNTACSTLVVPPPPPAPQPPPPPPQLTILVYNTPQGDTVEWNEVTFYQDGVTFALDTTYSYSATITSFPSSRIPSSNMLISVTIGNIVTTIGKATFRLCTSLATVIFTPTSQVATISVSAFSFTALTSITIPDSVTSINNTAFQGCNALAIVKISPETADLLGNQFNPPWTSPSVGISNFYGVPNPVNFELP
jgi:hypothetical protein